MVRARFDDSDTTEPDGSNLPAPLGPPLPLPLYQHPAVAGSIILVAAAVCQIAVWMVCMRLPPLRSANPSSLLVHGLLHDLIRDTLTSRGLETGQGTSILFGSNLLIGLFSGLAWYGVGRLGLGPKWGLWAGLFWVVHPSFAFLANQTERLNILVTILPVTWCVLLWWRRSHRPAVALLVGLLSATTCLVSFQGFILLVIALPAMALSIRSPGARFAGVAAAMTGFTAGIVILTAGIVIPRVFAKPSIASSSAPPNSVLPAQTNAWTEAFEELASPRLNWRDSIRLRAGLQLWRFGSQVLDDLGGMTTRLDTDLWNTVDDASGSPMAAAARTWRASTGQPRPSAVRFLADQFRTEPQQSVQWLARRFWRSVYATADGHIYYPVVLVHFSILVPALWGFWIAFRYRPWRWLAVTAGFFSLTQWTLVALAEPLAKNIVPIGGFSLLFALVGVTDVYERLFGRRLTAPAPASRPARLRRLQRNLADDDGKGD